MSARGAGGMLTSLPDAGTIALSPEAAGGANYRRVGDRWLLTNDLGHHAQLPEPHFRDYLEGRVGKEHPAWEELKSKGFLTKWLDFAGLVAEYRTKNGFLFTGAPLHFFSAQMPISPVAVQAAKGVHVPPAGQLPPGQSAAPVQTRPRVASPPPTHNRHWASLSQ